MKTAFISTILNYPWGGADTLWTRAAEEARQRGDDILLSISPKTASHERITSLATGSTRLLLRSSVSIPRDIISRIQRKVRSLIPSGEPLVKELTNWQPDLVIFSCGGTYDLILEPEWCRWLAESKTPYRIIANGQTEHPALGTVEWEAMRDILGNASQVFFVSTRNLEATRRHLLLPLPNALVVHNPLRFEPQETIPWPGEDEWHLATVSRLDHIKGIHLILHALALVLGNESAWKLNIYGAGPQEDFLRKTSTHLKLESRINFRGHVSSLPEIWGENHLMVSPAIDDGVPMTIPEAMLCGRPVLATCVGGAEDWISDGKTGFLSVAPTLPVIAEALLRCWGERSQWRRMGEEAAAFARGYYRAGDYKQVVASPA